MRRFQHALAALLLVALATCDSPAGPPGKSSVSETTVGFPELPELVLPASEPNLVVAEGCVPITPNHATYNQWTPICQLTTTRTTGLVLVTASAVLIRHVGLAYGALRIRDAGSTIMAGSTVSDYGDGANVIKNYPTNVTLVDNLSGSARTYVLEVAFYYGGTYAGVSDHSTVAPNGAEVGATMSNALWLKAIEY